MSKTTTKTPKRDSKLLSLFKEGTLKHIREQAHGINNLNKLNASREAKSLLGQLGARKSVINQADAHV